MVRRRRGVDRDKKEREEGKREHRAEEAGSMQGHGEGSGSSTSARPQEGELAEPAA